MVRVLLANGAAIDAPLWNRLRCLAEGQEMQALLDQWQPAGRGDALRRRERPVTAWCALCEAGPSGFCVPGRRWKRLVCDLKLRFS